MKYSRSLAKQLKESVKIMSKHNFIGKPTDEKNTRVLVSGNYLIFYKPSGSQIVIR